MADHEHFGMAVRLPGKVANKVLEDMT